MREPSLFSCNPWRNCQDLAAVTFTVSNLIRQSHFEPSYRPRTDTKEGRAGFVEWLKGVDKLQLTVWLEERKNFKARAKEEMESGGLRSAEI